MKNIDAIKLMSSEELGEFLGRACPPYLDDPHICIQICTDCWKQWLESENNIKIF